MIPPSPAPLRARTTHMLEWLKDHILLLSISFGTGLLFMAGISIYLVRMPADALVKKKRSSRPWVRIARNILGWVLIVGGAAMVFLPGPGFLVLLLGITMADFPGKKRVQTWLLHRKAIVGPINRLRKHFKQPKLKVTAAA